MDKFSIEVLLSFQQVLAQAILCILSHCLHLESRYMPRGTWRRQIIVKVLLGPQTNPRYLACYCFFNVSKSIGK